MRIFGKDLAGSPKLAILVIVAFTAIVILTTSRNCSGREVEPSNTEQNEKVA